MILCKCPCNVYFLNVVKLSLYCCRPVLSTGLVLVATSERHGDLSSGYIEEDLIESLKGQESEI